MAGRNGQELLTTWVPSGVAAAFRDLARSTEGGVSALLRRLVTEKAMGAPPPEPNGAGQGGLVMVRLKPAERVRLAEVSRARQTSPANWVRSLALVHLARRPQWNGAEVEALKAVFWELRAIGGTLNRIALALDVAAQAGGDTQGQGQAARDAAELVRVETRRVVSVLTGNFDYWGLPDDERPRGTREARERDIAETKAAVRRQKAVRRLAQLRHYDD